MNKTQHELCDEKIQLREQLVAAQASTNLARLAARQAMAKAEVLEQERDALVAQGKRLIALAKLVDKHAIEYGCTEELFDRIEKLGVAAIETPETSLAQRDAQMKAVMLEHVISMMPRRATIEAQLDWLVGERWEIEERLRRQAEGGAK